MKIKILFLLILATLFFQSCVSVMPEPDKIKLTAAVSRDLKTDPYGAVISEKKHMVSISHYQEIELAKDKTMFKLIIENGGKKPVQISSDNIMVTFKGSNRNSHTRNIHIQSQSELLKYIEKEIHKEEKKNIGKLIIYTSVTIRKLKTGAEPVTTSLGYQRKLEKAVNELKIQRKHYQQLKDMLPGLTINKQKIMPRKSILAILSCDTREMAPGIEGTFRVVVSVDGEKHEFNFQRKVT